MNNADKSYLDLLKDIMENGSLKPNRTGVAAKSVFGRMLRFNLAEGFPILTTKKVHFKSVLHELLWFLRGEGNISYLKENGVSIWDEWADENGELGPVYGVQWRKWTSVNHIIPKVFPYELPPTQEDLLYGVGHVGENDKKDGIYDVWVETLKKCYDITDNEYMDYGGKGVFVDKRWLNYSEFYQDVQKLENWLLKKEYPEEYCLVCYGSNKYSPETCRWVSKEESDINSKLETTNVTITDQIRNLIVNIKNNPSSRRLVVSAWNPAEVSLMKLPPCHMIFEFVVNDNKLSCAWFMRSIDAFLGLPFNICSYALLTHMVAKVCNLEVGDLIWFGGDTHIYENHFEQVKEQMSRKPYKLPTLEITGDFKHIEDFKYQHFSLKNYESHPAIKAPIAV